MKGFSVMFYFILLWTPSTIWKGTAYLPAHLSSRLCLLTNRVTLYPSKMWKGEIWLWGMMTWFKQFVAGNNIYVENQYFIPVFRWWNMMKMHIYLNRCLLLGSILGSTESFWAELTNKLCYVGPGMYTEVGCNQFDLHRVSKKNRNRPISENWPKWRIFTCLTGFALISTVSNCTWSITMDLAFFSLSYFNNLG